MTETIRRYTCMFACGHRKTSRNTTKNGRCRKCAAAQALAMREKTLKAIAARQAAQQRPRATWDKCDHPKTPENSAVSGPKGFTCKTCKRERDATYGHRGGRPKPKGKRRGVSPILQRIRFELVSVQPVTEAQTGRSYCLAPMRKQA